MEHESEYRFVSATCTWSHTPNFSYFDDLAFNRKLKDASKLSGAKRYRVYSRLALELERDDVPAAAIAWNTSRNFFSARIGCQVYQPVFGMHLAACACGSEFAKGSPRRTSR